MRQYDVEGRLHFPARGGGQLRLKMFLDESAGVKVQSLWDDIPPLNSQAQERLGYPTQKPEALLERIVSASTREGDVVLDPFCGCGTAVAVAQRLGRRWIGIDVTHLAINVIRERMVGATFDVIGEPADTEAAAQLANDEPYQFQWWLLGRLGAKPPAGGKKKGADGGIDGELVLPDGRRVVLSVKGGGLQLTHLRDLRGVVDREQAVAGALLSLKEPSPAMRKEAASAGFFQAFDGTKYPRLQLVTVADLFAGRGLDLPGVQAPGKRARRAPPKNEQLTLAGVGSSRPPAPLTEVATVHPPHPGLVSARSPKEKPVAKKRQRKA